MKMIKRLLWGALLCLPLCHSAIAGNEIRMEAPVRYVTAGEWLPADPLLGEPYDVNETCDEWAPSTDSMMEGLKFEQSTTCTTTSSQSVQQRELYSTTGVYRNVGPTTVKPPPGKSTKLSKPSVRKPPPQALPYSMRSQDAMVSTR